MLASRGRVRQAPRRRRSAAQFYSSWYSLQKWLFAGSLFGTCQRLCDSPSRRDGQCTYRSPKKLDGGKAAHPWFNWCDWGDAADGAVGGARSRRRAAPDTDERRGEGRARALGAPSRAETTMTDMPSCRTSMATARRWRRRWPTPGGWVEQLFNLGDTLYGTADTAGTAALLQAIPGRRRHISGGNEDRATGRRTPIRGANGSLPHTRGAARVGRGVATRAAGGGRHRRGFGSADATPRATKATCWSGSSAAARDGAEIAELVGAGGRSRPPVWSQPRAAGRPGARRGRSIVNLGSVGLPAYADELLGAAPGWRPGSPTRADAVLSVEADRVDV